MTWYFEIKELFIEPIDWRTKTFGKFKQKPVKVKSVRHMLNDGPYYDKLLTKSKG